MFWNTHRNKNINLFLRELIIQHDVSIVVLAEYEADTKELITELTGYGKAFQQYMSVGCTRLCVIGSVINVEPGTQTPYASIQIIDSRTILCCVHLPSNIYSDSAQRRQIAIQRIISDICSTEEELGTKDTIVVGDFNINPYDEACIAAPYFHSLPIYLEAKRGSRIIAGERFHMFYNPMWNFLGDFTEPFGTYYYAGSDTTTTYWNLFDQVIIRPDLRERFVESGLKILTETDSKYLLDNNGHPRKDISDHLPILFEIKEN